MKKKCLEGYKWIFQIAISDRKTQACLASSISAINLISLFNRLFLLYSNVHSNICLLREIDNATFSFLIFLVKIWSETAFLYWFLYAGIICFWIWLFVWWGWISRRGRGRGRNGGHWWATFFDKPPLICVEKFALRGSSKLKFFRGTAKSFVLKR